MKHWDDIVAAAVVGTDQRELILHPGPKEFDGLLAQLDHTDREGFLLSAASLVGLYRNAGLVNAGDTHSLPQLAERDDVPRTGTASGQHLAIMLAGEFSVLLPEWLAAMKQSGKRVPEEQLPALLEYGRTELSLRDLIVAVLGQRGKWLACQNPDWGYVIEREDKEIWETGNREERLLLFTKLREDAPTKAQELLSTSWSQEAARDRVAFLELFAPGLNSNDEAFLNEARRDRSAEVRRVARVLLVNLSSEFSLRLKDLVRQIVNYKKPLIGKARLEVILPEDPISWFKENDIEIENPPRSANRSFGAKGWFLKEMISLVPINFWNELWQKSPVEILRAADESDWRESFAEGFATAAQRNFDPDWAEALLLFTWSDVKLTTSVEIAAQLPPDRLEDLILRLLNSVSDGLTDSNPALGLLTVHHVAWSDQLSRAVINSVKKRISRGKDNVGDWQTRAVLKQFARYISPALYDELALGWPVMSDAWSAWSKHVHAFQSVLAFRRDMHLAISEGTESL